MIGHYLLSMAGCRSFTPSEERRLLRVIRSLPPRDRALLTAQWMGGYRISETLSLTVGSVLHHGNLRGVISIPPRRLKGGYGTTRRVPVSNELRRALEVHLHHLRKRWELTPELPLFISRKADSEGAPKPLTAESARLIAHGAFARAGIENDGQMGTHSFRKSWARKVYSHSGNCLITVAAALNHARVTTTQLYLAPNEDDVMAAMRAVDFTRKPRTKAKVLPFKTSDQDTGTQTRFA